MQPERFKILAIDDNPKNLKVIDALLVEHNFDVAFATTGREGLKMISETDYDLVLLDIMMPELDGIETCKIIKQEEKNIDLPVIFLTAKTDTESITDAFSSGGIDYVTKPFRGEELLARVRTHVDLKRLRDRQKRLNEWLEAQVSQRTYELKEANTELEKANQELATLDRAKNEFLRMINHEIRTPLNAILGFTEVIKSLPKSEEIVEPVQYLDQASLRLEKFLMIILQITELLSKGSHIPIESVNLGEVISAVTHKMKGQLAGKNISTTTSGGLLHLYLPGNSKLIRQCFECLLENAIQFSEPNSNITILADSNKDTIMVEIIDEGCGFSEKALKNLFGFFSIGEQHIDQNAGLGLALVKLIMDAHKGEIQVTNNQTKGAIVRLFFKRQ